ncbi:BTAD domain-containing putative transcriptional regulator [Nonomuraea sp. NPDC049709]|uniref:AfsR/SARP family transcriptional regulator n=1 Tax=Nonomuraea sp. NPDC049709 TaxID=3154736 RepID=UPI0034356212
MIAVRFSVLGPLSAARDGRTLPLPGGRIRILLAALLLRPNQAVSSDQLAERLWGQNLPRNPRRVLQTNIVRLRQSLDLTEVILTEPGGYVARLRANQLDLVDFQHLIRTAALAATPAAESRLLHQALQLWRGPVCADIESDVLHQIDIPPLTEQRLYALGRRIDLDLHLGRGAALIEELRALTAKHPLRERFWAQLMTALYRSGRQADAIDAYRTVSRLLREELGIDPTAELRDLHQVILTQQHEIRQHEPQERFPVARTAAREREASVSARARDGGQAHPPKATSQERPAALGTLLRTWREGALLTQEELAAKAGLNVRTLRRLEAGDLRRPRSTSVRKLAEALGQDAMELSIVMQASGEGPGGPGLVQTTVRQLPADVPAFAGREQELAVLDRIGDADTVAITVIDGMAGAGKTALAVRAGHLLASRFPDGDLFVDLHGFTRGTAPANPADTLARLLDVLGVPGESIPLHVDDRAALYRSVLAGRRMLIVLDNVANEAQVRPLLPGAGSCLVLVTSRRRLVGLDGALTVSVDVLPPADAVALFTAAAGRERVAGTPVEVLAEVVRRCGLLPLAIRLAAARLEAHPAWSVRHLLERLERPADRLGELHAGQRSVSGAFDLSYRALAAAERRAYRLLGLYAGVDITPDDAAALLATGVGDASALLDRLQGVHLLREPAPGRYRFHDLVRDHAAEVAARAEPEPDRPVAPARLLDHHSQAGQDMSG